MVLRAVPDLCRPRIFVSHSSADGDVARRLRLALEAEREQHKVTLLLDETELGPGDRWRTMLFRWLAECDGAILLLTPAALTKPWVQKEATILSWRAALRPLLRVVPVLLDGITRGDVERGFPAVDLGLFQKVSVPLDASDEKVEAVAREVLSRFPEGLDEPDDMLRWIGELHDQLHPVGANKLDDLARELALPHAEWALACDRSDRRPIAYELLHTETLLDVETCVTPVVRTVQDPLRFIRCVAPIGVPPASAGRMAHLFSRPAGRRVATLAGHLFETANRWVERANCSSEYYEQHESAPPLAEGDAVEAVLADASAWLRMSTGARRDDRIDRQLERIEPKGRRVLVLPVRHDDRPDALPQEVVREVIPLLCERYPHLVILVLTGADGALELEIDDVVRIEPGPTSCEAEEDDDATIRRLEGVAS